MKLLRKLRSRKGFTLTECLVAVAVFVVMSAIVMEMLAVCISSRSNNYRIEKDMDEQIQNIATDQALLERETINKTMKFLIGDGSASKDINVTLDVYRPDDDNAVNNRLELNTFTTPSTGSDTDKDKDKDSGAAMYTENDHFYGTKGLKGIYLHEDSSVDQGDMKKITMSLKIIDTDGVLKKGVANSVKLSLPKDSKNITATAKNNSSTLDIFSLSGNVIRFSDKGAGNKGNGQDYEATISFSVPKDSTVYESFKGFFGVDNGTTFKEKDDVPGVYSKS